uniref:NADH-ubiquinone oxidoreductase chain 2 n=1 Tax=Lophops carinata TaxID=130616 RepID=A0A7M1IBY5_9HEMI|nr:NADH dehydrogenase subunit 2 [Lophops carinata]QOQ36878.1 NADH dehydrogenase subunit 2 [Lophops carinata]
MKFNSNNTMMFILMNMSILMIMSSNNILYSWISMEINLFVFMPLISESKKMKDHPMKYFIIQSLSSSTMLMSILFNSFIDSPINSSIILMISMLMKSGMVPFHIWVPNLMYKLTWNMCLTISTIQKIPPTIIISQLTNFNLLIMPMVLSLTVGPLAALNQLSMKKIMAYSSISSSPWMISSLFISNQMFMLFLITYSMILLTIMVLFKKFNLNFINQMNSNNKNFNFTIIISSISLSGMPPTTGFTPKWMILSKMNEISMILSSTMIISSFMLTFVYLKMSKMLMMNNMMKKKNNKKNMFNNLFNIINLVGLPLTMILKST